VSDLDHLVAFRCRSCRRKMGYTLTGSSPERRVYCCPVCALVGPSTDNEERDALIVELHGSRRWSAQKLAGRFAISRQRVQQVLQQARS
jgi:hypothetical protein